MILLIYIGIIVLLVVSILYYLGYFIKHRPNISTFGPV